jgi:hypothetical protein
MTTVSQMIEWMKTLPQDAEVECGVEESRNYQTYMTHRPVNIEYCDVHDYTDEKYKDCPHVFGKIIVNLCGD